MKFHFGSITFIELCFDSSLTLLKVFREFKYGTLLGHKWRSHRKLIAPTFHLNVLKSFIELFNDNSRNVCKKMRALDGKTFDCHDYMSECTVEILLGELKFQIEEISII